MSTFAVFGMTECFARQKARASTATRVGGVDLTEGEWLEAVEQQVKKFMEGTRMVRLSQPYDAPQFCRDFMRLAEGGSRDLHIRCYAPVLDATGQPTRHKKTGKVRMKWQPLEEARKAAVA